MANLFLCSFDQYGTGLGPGKGSAGYWDMSATQIIGDLWAANPTMTGGTFLHADGSLDIKAPAWGARSGDYALVADGMNVAGTGSYGVMYNSTGTECLRLPLPGTTPLHRMIHFAYSCSALPLLSKQHGQIAWFEDSGGNVSFGLSVDPTGRLMIVDGTAFSFDHYAYNVSQFPLVLLTEATPSISPQTWYSISVEITTTIAGSTTHEISVYIGDITTANRVLYSAAITGSSANTVDILGVLPASMCGLHEVQDTSQRCIRDIATFDATGTYNTVLPGQCFISAQEARAEDAGGGWSAFARESITAGILDSYTTNTGISAADSADLELGASDFTLETHVRFNALPAATAGHEAQIVGKWSENSTGHRSYRLVYDGLTQKLRWEISTDGTTVVELLELPWVPDLNKWYDLAVSRNTSVSYLFINGVLQLPGVADANTYFNGAGILGIAGRFNTSAVLQGNSYLQGWMDETRLTVGTGRYTADYTPATAAFGRNSVDDPLYTSVKLLCGYEGGPTAPIVDESSAARTLTVDGSSPVTSVVPADLPDSYLVLNQRPAWDDTYMEAPETFATGRFAFTGLPAATETMTIGTQTYTWVATLSGSADEILIGATIADCVSNAIAAINAGAGAGTVYGTGTTANTSAVASVLESPQFDLTAATIGTAGNSVATTETIANGYFKAATLTGGQNLPKASDFSIERLPIDVTGVLAIQVTARAKKTDAGTAQIKLGLVGPSAGVATGTAQTVDLTTSWLRQIHEEDPDTSAGLTPSTLIGGKIRLDRTT